jgi:hypothetical protein
LGSSALHAAEARAQQIHAERDVAIVNPNHRRRIANGLVGFDRILGGLY